MHAHMTTKIGGTSETQVNGTIRGLYFMFQNVCKLYNNQDVD